MPLFGFLGGALRGGFGGGFGGGGALGGLLSNRSRGGSSQSSFSTPPAQNKDAPLAQEPEEQSQQAPKEQEAKPEQPQQQTPPAEQAAVNVENTPNEQQTAQKSPLTGLLDEAPSSKGVDSGGTEGEPAAPSVVNKTETMTPVARPVDEQAGSVPTTFRNDGILSQLMDSGNNQQSFEYQEGMPSRSPNIEGRSFVYQGPSGVSLPARRYTARA